MFSRGFGAIGALAAVSLAVSYPDGIIRQRPRHGPGPKPIRVSTRVSRKQHDCERERARRLRQAERIADRRAERLRGTYWERNGHTEVVGISRRGNPIFAAQ